MHCVSATRKKIDLRHPTDGIHWISVNQLTEIIKSASFDMQYH